MYEVSCETNGNCNPDQKAFKAGLARGLKNFQTLTASSSSTLNGTTSTAAQSQAAKILRDSAEAAAAQCTGGDDGTQCGLKWTSNKWDGTSGVGQDLDALEVILANLPAKALNTANSTSTGVSSNGTATSTESSSTGTESGSAQSASSTTSGAAGVWSSSAFVALFSAAFISLLRLSM